MGLSFPVYFRWRAKPAGAAEKWQGHFHVLVQAQGLDMATPDGCRFTGFQAWRVVRAPSLALAEAQARSRVADDWARCASGQAPELTVVASSRLGWLARRAARDTPFEFIP